MVCWVMESMCSFAIAEDRGFKCMIKTGHPEQYVPSHFTIAHDVREVFKNVWKRIAAMLQVSIAIVRYKENSHLPRNMMKRWALWWTLGHPQITRPTLRLWFILSTRVNPCACFLTLLRSHAHIPGRIWHSHLQRFLMTSEFLTKLANIVVDWNVDSQWRTDA